jgi:hypothetical protein
MSGSGEQRRHGFLLPINSVVTLRLVADNFDLKAPRQQPGHLVDHEGF